MRRSVVGHRMSRFSNLEFPQDPGEADSPDRSVSIGEDHQLAEALKAYDRGDFERALRRYARALEDNARSRPAWLGQVRMLLEMERFEEADAWADRALEVLPRDPEVLAAKAWARSCLGHPEEALALSDASFEGGSPTPEVWLARGEVLLRRGDRQGDECLVEAENSGAGDWRVGWRAARIHMGHGRHAKALSILQRAIHREASAAVLWVQRGECESVLGMRDAAEASFRRALELRPDCPAAMAGLGQLTRLGVMGRVAGLWKRLQRQ
ncbi:MAG: tetratricopeptide repeat protein [Verrucomicrobiales bacterium]|nr:tetratricopeptide repeat protein [Verrucomicrobiales bacterium]